MTGVPARPGRNLGVQVGLRADSKEQAERWHRAASADGLTFAAFARRALDAAALKILKKTRERP